MPKDLGIFYLHHHRGAVMDSIREIIFGLEDGMVSTLGVIVGIAAGTNDRTVVIFAGFVVILVEALSMSAGTYLSTKSEKELEQKFLREEEDEIRKTPDHERAEVLEMLEKQGYKDPLKQQVYNHIVTDKKRWLDFMALHELKIFPEKFSLKYIVRDATAMWFSYIIGGLIALIAFFFMPLSIAPWLAVGFVAFALFLLGAFKGILLKLNWIVSGLEMMLVALVASGVGYAVGSIAGQLLDVSV